MSEFVGLLLVVGDVVVVGGLGVGVVEVMEELKSMLCWDSTALASGLPWMSVITSRASLCWAVRLDGCCMWSLRIWSISRRGIKVKSRR